MTYDLTEESETALQNWHDAENKRFRQEQAQRRAKRVESGRKPGPMPSPRRVLRREQFAA